MVWCAKIGPKTKKVGKTSELTMFFLSFLVLGQIKKDLLMQDWVFRLGSLVIYVGGRSYEVVCGWNGAYKRHVRFPFITSYRHPIPTLLLAFYKLSSTTLLA